MLESNGCSPTLSTFSFTLTCDVTLVLPELSSAQLSHGFGALGSQAELSGNDPETEIRQPAQVMAKPWKGQLGTGLGVCVGFVKSSFFLHLEDIVGIKDYSSIVFYSNG